MIFRSSKGYQWWIYSVGVFLIFGVIGCSENKPTTRYYFLETPKRSKDVFQGETKHSVFLLFKKAVSLSPYDTANFVVKIRPSEVQFYNYAKWVSPPQEMLYHYLFQSLTYNRLAQISEGRITHNKYYQLDVEIQEFGQSFKRGKPYGSIKLFIGLKQSTSKGYIWYSVYDLAQPAKTETPYDVVIALNKAMVQINQQILKDVDTFLASQLQGQ